MDGCVGMSMLVDRASGRCIATSSWESEAAMRDSADRVRPLRDGAERALGASSSTVDTWEVAVVHRDHAMPDGACARVTWLSGRPTTPNAPPTSSGWPSSRGSRSSTASAAPACSSAARPAGPWAPSPSRRREQLEASREAATAIREAASRDIGATIDDVAEMEVAFAHLHLPEMV